MQVNRMAFGRSITPVDIPVDMMQKESTSNEERPHCKFNELKQMYKKNKEVESIFNSQLKLFYCSRSTTFHS